MSYAYEIDEAIRLTDHGRSWVEEAMNDVGQSILIPEVYGRIVGRDTNMYWLVSLPFDRREKTEGQPINVWPLATSEIEPVVERKPKATRTGDIVYHNDQPMGILVEDYPVVPIHEILEMREDAILQAADNGEITAQIMNYVRERFARHGAGDTEVTNVRVENGVAYVTATFRPRPPLEFITMSGRIGGLTAEPPIFDEVPIETYPADRAIRVDENGYIMRFLDAPNAPMLQESVVPLPALTPEQSAELQRIIEGSTTQFVDPPVRPDTHLTRESFQELVRIIEAQELRPAELDLRLVRAMQQETNRLFEQEMPAIVPNAVPQDVND